MRSKSVCDIYNMQTVKTRVVKERNFVHAQHETVKMLRKKETLSMYNMKQLRCSERKKLCPCTT